MHAMCLNILDKHLQPGMRAFDIGSGSGYLTAAMAKLVGEHGKVVGVEHLDELVEFSKRNLQKDSPDLSNIVRWSLILL